jgi:type I restriction enzyme M protein
LLIARHFPSERAAIEELESAAATAAAALEELADEHGGADGLLADARNEKDKLTRASVTARLKEIKSDPDAADERKPLSDYLSLLDNGAALSGNVTAARESLDAKVASKYGNLTEEDVRIIVVHDKWLAAIEASVRRELDQVSKTLSGRVCALADRYGTAMPELSRQLTALSARVDSHLRSMGAKWN